MIDINNTLVKFKPIQTELDNQIQGWIQINLSLTETTIPIINSFQIFNLDKLTDYNPQLIIILGSYDGIKDKLNFNIWIKFSFDLIFY